MRPDPDYVSVFETGDPALLPVVTSLLQSAGIPFVTQGEGAMGVLPLGVFSERFYGRALAVRIEVPAGREAEARALLRTLEEGAGPDGEP